MAGTASGGQRARRAGPKTPAAASVDDYLAKLPEEQRAALEQLRQTIKAAAPMATELISYSVPAYRHHGMLVSFFAAQHHCTFHLMSPDAIDAHATELEGFDLTKGGIRFSPDRPIPTALVTKLVKARVAENELRAAT